MSFRTVLAPIIQIFRWFGISSFPLFHREGASFWRKESLRFVAITFVNILINFCACIRDLSGFDYGAETFYERVLMCVLILLTVLLRTHAITVLVESCAKRSIQLRLLTTFDGIEKIFAEYLNMPSQKQRLVARFRKYIVIWIVKNGLIVLVLSCNILLQEEWFRMINVAFLLIAFSTIGLSITQWLVYVDVVRFNLERINVCLANISNEAIPGIARDARLRIHVFDGSEKCERIIQLRKCLSKTWQASMMIDRLFRWSTFICSGNELILLVINLYWILYTVVVAGEWSDIFFCSYWALVICSNFTFISMICEDINSKV